MTPQDTLAAAFAAIKRGDYAERDRLCAQAQLELRKDARDRALARVMAVDFFVKADGTAISSRAMLGVLL